MTSHFVQGSGEDNDHRISMGLPDGEENMHTENAHRATMSFHLGESTPEAEIPRQAATGLLSDPASGPSEVLLGPSRKKLRLDSVKPPPLSSKERDKRYM